MKNTFSSFIACAFLLVTPSPLNARTALENAPTDQKLSLEELVVPIAKTMFEIASPLFEPELSANKKIEFKALSYEVDSESVEKSVFDLCIQSLTQIKKNKQVTFNVLLAAPLNNFNSPLKDMVQSNPTGEPMIILVKFVISAKAVTWDYAFEKASQSKAVETGCISKATLDALKP